MPKKKASAKKAPAPKRTLSGILLRFVAWSLLAMGILGAGAGVAGYHYFNQGLPDVAELRSLNERKSPQVTRVLAADGTVDAQNSKIIVEAGTLQTDQAMRDNFVRRNVLQTDQYKEIVFVPKQVSGLPNPLPGSGALNFKLSGDLTIRSVTKPVTWDVTGTVNGDSATGSAITSFQFADFQLNQPQVPVVLSIVDKITLKIDLTLQRSSN